VSFVLSAVRVAIEEVNHPVVHVIWQHGQGVQRQSAAWDRTGVSRTCCSCHQLAWLVDRLFALLALNIWWCHRSNCQKSALELSRGLVLTFGIVCLQTLPRHHRCRPFVKDWKLTFSDYHFHISSVNLFILCCWPCSEFYLGHSKNILIELNYPRECRMSDGVECLTKIKTLNDDVWICCEHMPDCMRQVNKCSCSGACWTEGILVFYWETWWGDDECRM